MIRRGKFGIEYFPHPAPERTPGLGLIAAFVGVAAAVSLGVSAYRRYVAATADAAADAADVAVEIARDVPPPPSGPSASSSAVASSASPAGPAPVARRVSEPEPERVRVESYANRPPKVRNLLLRLDEAKTRHDTEMELTTIEQLRALPGSPAADLDDALARRLGTLNLRRLFVLKNAQWVTRVTVRAGMYAGRIASEHGSTLASCVKLNGGSVDCLRIGDSIWVMNHPRFNLVVRRRPRTADLALNGKFFRRYDLLDVPKAVPNAYEMPVPSRPFWTELGIRFRPEDRAELEMLLPKGTSVIVSEM